MSEALSDKFDRTDFIDVAQAPIPEGGGVHYFNTVDGAKLRMAAFGLPNQADARGTVLLLTGRSEFIEKYGEVVRELQDRGFNVAIMDWRGQGLSSRMLPEAEKGHIKTFGTYTADLKLFMAEFVEPQFAGPYFILSHSMGGLPVLSWLADGTDKFTGAVLCAPMTRLPYGPVKGRVIRSMAKIGAKIGMSKRSIIGVKEHSMKFEGNKLTTDKTRHRSFQSLLEAAPNAAVHAPTYGWLDAAYTAMSLLNKPKALDNINCPVLILGAGNDETVDASHAQKLAERQANISYQVIAGAKHEILMEQDNFRQALWQAFDRFMAPLA
ncbi:MAG: alpha/beta hydrolase [Parvularculaceae bacterium]